jgi:L-alanine-DL-glutamate epimerase-like enolase superfamily enzyme
MTQQRIASLEADHFRIPLPVTLSDSTHGDITHFELITARLRDAEGAEGLGYTYTVGTGGAAIHALVDRDLRPVLEGADPCRIEAIFERMWWHLHFVGRGGAASFAMAAIDIALHDLAAQMAGVPLFKFLGLQGDRLPPTSVTVPIATADEMVTRAEKLRDHPILKLKVGFDGDVEMLRSIREVYDGEIRIDANEGWKEDEAVDRLAEMAGSNVAFCEQPVHADDENELFRVAESSPIPIFADESACTSGDVARLAQKVAGVNLKLRKAGGIREVIKGISVARAHRVAVMIGCDLETGVGCTAAAHLGSLVDHLDVDGFLLLERDPYPGVTSDRGRLALPTAPGLGVSA